MKSSLALLLLFFINPIYSLAQLTADAGSDIYWCYYPSQNHIDTLYLGGSPTATGGTPPYTYTWHITPIEIGYSGSGLFYHASDMINDTTLPNPTIEGVKEVTIFLTVTDAVGDIAHDSTKYYPSMFTQHLDIYNAFIMEGDSFIYTQYPNIQPNFYPVASTVWYPSYGLSDSTLETGFWVKPDTSIIYGVKVTDSLGCQGIGTPFFNVVVTPVGIENVKSESNHFSVFPNPANNYISINLSQAPDIIRIISSNGQIVKEEKSRITRIDISNLSSGVYVIQVLSGKDLYSASFIKE